MNTPVPPVSAADLATDEEEFHSSYRIFINAVDMLASSAEEQCALMGNYNVAWELKEDVSNGRYLLGRGYLSESAEAWVASLVAALESVNTLVLPAGPGVEANLRAMQHARWAPLRFFAAQVAQELSSFTAENAAFLRLPTHAV
jgi:hypothetical protein